MVPIDLPETRHRDAETGDYVAYLFLKEVFRSENIGMQFDLLKPVRFYDICRSSYFNFLARASIVVPSILSIRANAEVEPGFRPL